ncbi:Lipase 1 [Cyphellophora attinorum]|uniref:Carboxylic ester hydrolase n=1 Tax=Cyphellophora attinorum TaxID=1664694 RepID=A0A0N0NIR1_9EURO|nr:Lipase 1 [Phialophora attinorum]KPI36038.1 Lipase 1 [Phialophora attinorum]
MATLYEENTKFPSVDLGYARYQPDYHESGGYYDFQNIRYAAPPTGNRRFQPPVPVSQAEDHELRAPETTTPPQAVPAWVRGTEDWSDRGTEDCCKVPVLVWLYGGGYTAGSKELFGSGAGLLARAAKPMIYVALNYRLGIFGFLGGPDYIDQGGTSNLGLLDQRFGLEWVQEHISLFGGDPDEVTVMGQSAGGGSILHQITAYGGSQGPSPFKRAVLQSPGFYPITSPEVMNRDFRCLLEHAKCESLEELKMLSGQELKVANLAVIDTAPYGQFLLGPVVDGTFVPDLPGRLLLDGQFDKDLDIMLGQCFNEGGDYVEPVDISEDYMSKYLDRTFSSISLDTKNHIMSDLYPPADGSNEQALALRGHLGFSSMAPFYSTPTARLQRLISDAVYIQHNNALSQAFREQNFNYLWSASEGRHGADLAYTFYAEDEPPIPVLPPVKSQYLAHALQKYITNFVISGDPNGENDDGLPTMERRGQNGLVLEIRDDGFKQTSDPSDKEQCAWWQQNPLWETPVPATEQR